MYIMIKYGVLDNIQVLFDHVQVRFGRIYMPERIRTSLLATNALPAKEICFLCGLSCFGRYCFSYVWTVDACLKFNYLWAIWCICRGNVLRIYGNITWMNMPVPNLIWLRHPLYWVLCKILINLINFFLNIVSYMPLCSILHSSSIKYLSVHSVMFYGTWVPRFQCFLRHVCVYIMYM